jgi:hypothetical protein
MSNVEDFSKFLSGRCWADSSDQCQDWLDFKDEIDSARSMENRPQPYSGKGLLTYLSRSDASQDFQKLLDKHGFMYYQLFTSTKVTLKQKEKLYRTKQFIMHLGRRSCLFSLVFFFLCNLNVKNIILKKINSEFQKWQGKECRASVFSCTIAYAK